MAKVLMTRCYGVEILVVRVRINQMPPWGSMLDPMANQSIAQAMNHLADSLSVRFCFLFIKVKGLSINKSTEKLYRCTIWMASSYCKKIINQTTHSLLKIEMWRMMN